MRTQSESIDNHIVQAMLPVYAEAREVKGKAGTPRDRLLNFERNVTRRGTGVWMRAHDSLRDELEGLTKKQMRELKISIEIFFKDIEDKFEMLCSDKTEETQEEVELREKLEKVLVLAREKLDCEVRPIAARLFGEVQRSE